jgi:hypothetical protein
MHCYCCGIDIRLGRKVKLRPWREYDPDQGGLDSAAYLSYVEEMTYRWAFICHACYRTLDNDIGLAEVSGRLFNIAGASRRDKAAVVDEAKYRAFQQREAQKLGLDL